MTVFRLSQIFVFGALVFVGCTQKESAPPTASEVDQVYAKEDAKPQTDLKGVIMVEMQTSKGNLKIELYPEKAPQTVANFLKYVEAGFYDGTLFHRVIDGFMIQGGGFQAGMKEKDTNAPVKNESSNGLKNDEMTLAMARTNDPDSATAQFFINLNNNDFLNGSAGRPGYAVFGKVIEGQDVVRSIGKVSTTTKGYFEDVPEEDVSIISAKVAK